MDSPNATKHEHASADARHGHAHGHAAEDDAGVDWFDGKGLLRRIYTQQRALLAGQRALTDLVVDFIEHQASNEADKAELKRQLRARLDRLKTLGGEPPPP